MRGKHAATPPKHYTWVLIGSAVVLIIAIAAAGIAESRQNQQKESAEVVVSVPVDAVIDEPVTSEPLWSLLLVNTDTPLPEGYEEALSLVQPFENSTHQVDIRIEMALKAMFRQAEQAGYELFLRSGYRSYETQTTLFDSLVQEYKDLGYTDDAAYTAAKKLRNLPGTSEHETGLAVDLLPRRLWDANLVARQLTDEPELVWLRAHCAEFGFILRYPDGKQEITGTSYEPWHFRYVGVEDAEKIMKSELTFEEYLTKPAIPLATSTDGERNHPKQD